MRAILTSDTHYSRASARAIDKLLMDIVRSEPDIVFHAGDWASSTQSEFRTCLERFRRVLRDTRIIAVRGNHDLWDGDHEYIDLDSMFDSHKQWCAQNDIELLSGGWIELAGGVYVAGWDGWYGHPNPPTNDQYFIPRPAGQDIHTLLRGVAEAQLDHLLGGAPTGVKVALTHFPAFSESPVYHNLCAPLSHHKLLLETFDYLLIGHSHRRLDYTDGRCRVINAGSEYRAPKYISFEIPTP